MPFRKYVAIFVVELFLSIAVFIFILYGGYHWCDYIAVPSSKELSTRFIYTLRCSIPMVLCLFFAISGVVFRRATNPKLASPLFGNEDLIQVDKNFLQNTLEQLCLSLPLLLIATTYFDCPQLMKLFPIYSLLFVIGRLFFRIGYGIHSAYRSFGMLINIYCNWCLIGLLLYLVYTKGMMYGLGNVVYPMPEEGGSTSKMEL